MSKESRLIEYLREMPVEEFPARVRRIRRRKNETEAKWKDRALIYLEKLEEEERNKQTKLAKGLDQDTHHLVQDALRQEGFTGEEALERYMTAEEWAPLIPTYVSPFDTKAGPADGPASSDLRGVVGSWVEATRISKEAEADCDLDCLNCVTAKMMLCAFQNESAYVADGH